MLDQPADGYTLFLGTSGNMATNKVLYRNLKFDPERDFIPISIAYASCNVLIVPATSPIKSIPDLIAEAKRRPGALSFGSPGVGTAGHLIGELFKSRAGVDLVHVPYRGQAQVINDLLGGHLAMSFEAVATAIPVVQAGTARGLATTCPQRSPQIAACRPSRKPACRISPSRRWRWSRSAPRRLPPIVARLNEAVVEDHPGDRSSPSRITGMGLIAEDFDARARRARCSPPKWRAGGRWSQSPTSRRSTRIRARPRPLAVPIP